MSATETTMQVPQGNFALQRRPRRRRELLRAWDAADEYLLREVAAQGQLAGGTRVLLINDSFGALAVALAPRAPQSWSDSFLSQLATRDNLSANNIDAARRDLAEQSAAAGRPGGSGAHKSAQDPGVTRGSAYKAAAAAHCGYPGAGGRYGQGAAAQRVGASGAPAWALPIRPWHGRRPN
jgi:hypothetical protein